MAFITNPQTAFQARPNSSAGGVQRWQERDRDIVEFVCEHPATAEQIARIFFTGGTSETTRKKANRRLNRLSRKRMIRAIGLVLPKGSGRPQIIYGGNLIRLGMLEHEILITELRLHFLQHEFQRSVSVGKTIADALLHKDQTKFWIEVDTGRMSMQQMRVKWLRYGDCRDFILIVCQHEKRLHKLKESAERVKHLALFTTFDRLKSGRAEPWEDCNGQTTNV